MQTKHPIGIKPMYLWKEDRWHELSKAICRYAEAGYTVPIEWVNEYNQLHQEIFVDQFKRGNK